MSDLKHRYDFLYYFDVKDGNPNGDPDAGNMPRIDAETGEGLVTDVCLKRKARNYIQITQSGVPNRDIFVKEKAVLNQLIDKAHEQDDVKKYDEKRGERTEAARRWMCAKYYDVRGFGAVMSTGKNAGQVRGPIQLTFARSVEPIIALEHSITRMAVATEAEAEKQSGDNRTMGRKYTVPYGLYRGQGFVSAHLAAQTGFSEEDLDMFWEALENMFEHDHSAARGLMSARRLVIFEHATALGNKPAHELFERVTCERITEGPARNFTDYRILLDGAPLETFKTLVPVG
jgi:CRISPR-associated protein Csd2